MKFTAAATVTRLGELGAQVAVAESLTAGLVVDELARIPGASEVLRGGVVAYASAIKAAVLGVEEDLLQTGGAVQAAVARQMVLGVCRLMGSDYGIATTGVAGPGPAEGRAAGTVIVAAGSRHDVRVRQLQLAGTREAVRRTSVAAALALLASVLEDAPRDREHLGDERSYR